MFKNTKLTVKNLILSLGLAALLCLPALPPTVESVCATTGGGVCTL